ncbi:cell envelope integrity protein TolA [Acidovorax sp. sic0104]|uniref:cell envelope integrity protein TolA n=1 Tax=Acidovorax sp. sic0104 TaxID=2854784 RepID=UPI001C4920DF|nr:cell envelope integrity protein TolA [Acidovorax sp. sic0104]MBV7543679.1 cell envelope integrity protein TolA [Acidovorax sp. sic0104]
MQAHNDRDQFAPPRPPARLRAITLAVLAHAVLIGALTWGVNWKSSADQPAVEAELWAAVPQQAAPRAVEPPPPPPAPAPTEVRPPPPPAPPPAPRAVEPPDTREADIAIEREKKRLEQEKKAREQQQEREKRERDRKEEERKDRLEQEKKERLQKEKDKEKEQREKQLAEQKKAEQDKQKKLAEDKRKAEEAAKRKEADDKQLAKLREDNLRRMQGLAGATGGETATGTAQRSAGPSGSYGGKVAAKVKPNIVYPDAISGNPRAEVEVRLSPDGTIVGKRLVQSSGNKAWDDAVLRALDKTETLPRDVDGRVPSSLTIGFRPQD